MKQSHNRNAGARVPLALLMAALFTSPLATAQDAAATAPPPPGPYTPLPQHGYGGAPVMQQAPPVFRPDPDMGSAGMAPPTWTPPQQDAGQAAANSSAPAWTPPPAPEGYRRQGAITREAFMNQQSQRRADMDKRRQEAETRHQQARQSSDERWQAVESQQAQLRKEMQEREAQLYQEMEQRRADLQKEMLQREEEIRQREQEMSAERERFAPRYAPPQQDTGYAQQQQPAQPAQAQRQQSAPLPGPQWHPAYGNYPAPGGYGYAPPPGYGPPSWATAPYPPNFPAPAAGSSAPAAAQ